MVVPSPSSSPTWAKKRFWSDRQGGFIPSFKCLLVSLALASMLLARLPNSNFRRYPEELFSSSLLDRGIFKDPIRKWGCGLKQTPFVFVHIGKAGGGNIRRRIAASAVNFTRDATEWAETNKDEAYYPILDEQNKEVVAKARFCSSGQFSYRPTAESGFETVVPCSASTPLGLAIACAGGPEKGMEAYCGGDPTNRESAHVVYVGHNNIGSELHWLPVPILEEWWRNHWAESANGTKDGALISRTWPTMDGKQAWCGRFKRPLYHTSEKKRVQSYVECGKNMQVGIDKAALSILSQQRVPLRTSRDRGKAYAALYASLPVLRVTMLRDPFSWLASKFLWHNIAAKSGLKCDDIESASFGAGTTDSKGSVVLGSKTGPGWARRQSLKYLYGICGSDCASRHLKREADLEELVKQAEYNLRYSFAVVGLLEESDEQFFKMIHSRVDYIDTTINLNKVDEEGDHSTASRGESKRCKDKYQNEDFQAQFMAAAPEVAALVRLYKVAVEVNQFQALELDQCNDSFLASHGVGKQHG